MDALIYSPRSNFPRFALKHTSKIVLSVRDIPSTFTQGIIQFTDITTLRLQYLSFINLSNEFGFTSFSKFESRYLCKDYGLISQAKKAWFYSALMHFNFSLTHNDVFPYIE